VATSKIPDSLARRLLIEKEMDASASLAIAEAYLEDGRVSESLDFLVKADAQERIDQLFEEAIEAGDAFAVQVIARTTDREPDANCWERVARAAEAAGKERYAATALRQIGRGEG
jgi:hypothetical protein